MENLQNKQNNEIFGKIWKMCEGLRGNMDGSEFKNYILGMIFYRYLSENLVTSFKENTDADFVETCKDNLDTVKDVCLNQLTLGYFIEPQYLFQTLKDNVDDKEKTFTIDQLDTAIHKILVSESSQKEFEHLFDDMDLTNVKLGKTVGDRTKLMSNMIDVIGEIELEFGDAKIDILGNVYSYLMEKFASTAGKSGGEFYTPFMNANLIAKLATVNCTNIESVYDPCCGSMGLPLAVNRELRDNKGGRVNKFYGQESNPTTYNLARMNMLLHGVPFERFDIFWGDTIVSPCPEHNVADKFDVVVANPPFSQDWKPTDDLLLDPRFRGATKLAPKSYEDYMFLEHMIYTLSETGTLVCVLPHGPLFRGGAEEVIRKYIVDKRNYLDAVIGLPEKCFFGTGIATVLLVIKKCKTDKSVLFIDASKEFNPSPKQNVLDEIHVNKIVNTYINRKDVDKYAHLATYEELTENGFNLNISRYVDSFEEEEPVDLKQLMGEIKELKAKRNELEDEVAKYLKELGIED